MSKTFIFLRNFYRIGVEGTMYELLGYHRSKGEYQGRPYDNWSLHFRNTESPKNHQGEFFEVISVRSSLIPEDQLVIGEKYQVYYNRFGKVSELKYC